MSNPREWRTIIQTMENSIEYLSIINGPRLDAHSVGTCITVIEKTPHVEKCIGMHGELVEALKNVHGWLISYVNQTYSRVAKDEAEAIEKLLTKAGQP